jgi:hypothetical protein
LLLISCLVCGPRLADVFHCHYGLPRPRPLGGRAQTNMLLFTSLLNLLSVSIIPAVHSGTFKPYSKRATPLHRVSIKKETSEHVKYKQLISVNSIPSTAQNSNPMFLISQASAFLWTSPESASCNMLRILPLQPCVPGTTMRLSLSS